ncbi:MAG TPA: hypothetical protein VFQ59_03700 [Candidatus Paceibacterota bacterium]|nr:hypothetical protein [Candidatus Paceibacterota bacterium]
MITNKTIYKTSDGGITWSIHFTDTLTRFTTVSVKNDVLASAWGNIYISRDFGLTWETQNIPDMEIRGVGIIDSSNIFATSYCGNEIENYTA